MDLGPNDENDYHRSIVQSFEYISGEEMLSSWAPRGVSLIRDYMELRKKLTRVSEIEAARGVLSLAALEPPTKGETPGTDGFNEHQKELVERILGLWQTGPTAGEFMLLRSNTESPEHGVAFANGTFSRG